MRAGSRRISKLSSRLRRDLLGLAVALPCAFLALAATLRAEPVTDRALQGSQLFTQQNCTQIKIGFNYRVRYASHFPIHFGDEVRIQVRALDPAQARGELLTRRESLRAPGDARASIKAIEIQNDPATGPVLIVQFNGPVHYQVGQGADFESIVLAISGQKPSSTCRPAFPETTAGGWAASVTRENGDATQSEPHASVPARSKTRGQGAISEGDKRAAEAAMDEARAALRKNNAAEAIRLLGKVLKFPETTVSAEAQELLGLARQRNGDPAEAEAEYQDYLTRYPSTEGAERVRQRLAGLQTAKAGAAAPLREGSSTISKTSRSSGYPTDGTSTWTVSGSASQFYIRDDSFRTLRDPSLPPDLNTTADDHRVHQNELLSSLDLISTYTNADSKWKFRFSGTEEHSFVGDQSEIVSVAALFLETRVREWDLETRIGRQTRNTGGVLGRFDGALLRYQAAPWLGVNLVGGSPVQRRRDEPFKDDRYFYGASLDIGPFIEGLDVSLFAIEDRSRSFLDRRAVGAEARYLSQMFAAFATIDYDIHFNELNAAILSGTWTFADKSVLTAGFDYRKSPYLSAWTALQGQPFVTLYDLLKAHTLAEADQWASDRTATYISGTAGYTYPINQNLQVSADVTVTDTTGTISSGGVLGTPSTGTEYYTSAQIIANDMITPGDSYVAGLRFADLADSKLYVADFSARYPLTESWRVGPRLRFGYREGDSIDLTEYSVLPSLLVNYSWSKDMNLEIEAGARWTDTTTAGNVNETSTELFLTVGYRYDFYADGKVGTPKAAGP